ncbi:hypothetical protein [Rhodococcus pyridinivorans]|uniref:Uncharacterized protein n=1 Tax=Rhodococcus pyridinivorans AK37 TaxID=1114960 RepID=H0JYP2_9NOCA|nr:hypothetical protein [Rhodococcus pyridinivorans]EHK80487.1 hypothetical protein AK37_24434 [Rhodococcus pyridinivorans AK37]MCD2142353.1 hypothetical protein [Rhodococcus pyridinivorans]
MRKPITAADVAVQVERSRSDVWVPEGLALQKLPYTPAGITLAFDALNGLSLQEKRNDSALLPFGPFVADVVDGWVSVRPNTYDPGDDAPTQSVGPSLVETTVPVPVVPGMEVAMTGTVKVRRSGLVFKSSRNTTDFNDPVGVRATLFGLKTTVDGYGNTNAVAVRLAEVQTELQPVDSTSMTELVFPFGDPAAPSWATVPEDVDRVMFAVELMDLYRYAVTHFPASIPYRFTDTANRYVFRSPQIDSTTDNPIRLHLRDSANAYPTYPHPLSSTGYAFRDRARFENITPGVEITALAAPDGPAVTVSVYEWTTTRGALLATLEIPAGQKRTAPLDHTGAIDVVGTGTFYVESVLAPAYETSTVEQTRTTRYEYDTITPAVSSISTTLREADLSIALVRFVAGHIDTALPAGRRVRILSPGQQIVPIFTGTIRTRRRVNLPNRPTQLEVGIYDAWPRLSGEYPLMFDELHEYGPALHRLGEPVLIDGYDYTGPRGPMPDWATFNPSYRKDQLALVDSLIAARNTNNAYLFTDRRGRLNLTSTLPDSVALTASDMPADGDVSYSRQLEVSTDSASIVNVVTVDEHLIDRDEYLDRELSSQSAPQTSLREYPNGLARSISYRDPDSVDRYGPTEVRFPVIRGSGSLEDIEANNFGPPLQWWAQDILDVYAHKRVEFTRFTIPIESAAQIPLVAALQPFDAVAVRHDGSAEVVRPRVVKHTITPSGWECELDMSVRRDQALWLPPAPELPAPTADGDGYANFGPGIYDGGRPTDTGTGIIDGGDIGFVEPDPHPEWSLVDDFTRADQAELSAPWVRGAETSNATIGITSGAAVPAANNARARYYHSTPLGPFHRVEVQLGSYPEGSNAAGVLLRAAPGLDAPGIIAYVTDTNWYVSYFGDGLNAILWASGPHVRAAGDVIRADIVWHHLTVSINGTVVHERFDLGPISFGEHVGLFARGPNTRIELWRAVALDRP